MARVSLPHLSNSTQKIRAGEALRVGPRAATCLHVLREFRMRRSALFPKRLQKEALAAFGRALTEWVETHVPDTVEVHPHVLHGTIYDEILRAADKLEADVIVMGSHRPALKDYLLGPNAARVMRHARCSVYVVRA